MLKLGFAEVGGLRRSSSTRHEDFGYSSILWSLQKFCSDSGPLPSLSSSLGRIFTGDPMKEDWVNKSVILQLWIRHIPIVEYTDRRPRFLWTTAPNLASPLIKPLRNWLGQRTADLNFVHARDRSSKVER